ncbi:MAG: hypothetical protein V1676_05395 [Candidatus Diapherotrites archaeon]
MNLKLIRRMAGKFRIRPLEGYFQERTNGRETTGKKMTRREKKILDSALETACDLWMEGLHSGKKKEFVLKYYNMHSGKENMPELVYAECKKHFLGTGFDEKRAHMLAWSVERECREFERRRSVATDPSKNTYRYFLGRVELIAGDYFKKHEAKIGSPGFLKTIRDDAYKRLIKTGKFDEKRAGIFASNIEAECGRILRIRNEAKKYLEKYGERLDERHILETIFNDAYENSIKIEKRPERGAETIASRITDECARMLNNGKMAAREK